MTRLTNLIRVQLSKMLRWQLVIIIGLAIMVGVIKGMSKGWAVCLGGLAYWLPTVMFFWCVSAFTGARAATRFIIAFFAGETVKLILSCVLFLVALRYCQTYLLYQLIGFMSAIVGFWIVSARLSLKVSGGKSHAVS